MPKRKRNKISSKTPPPPLLPTPPTPYIAPLRYAYGPHPTPPFPTPPSLHQRIPPTSPILNKSTRKRKRNKHTPLPPPPPLILPLIPHGPIPPPKEHPHRSYIPKIAKKKQLFLQRMMTYSYIYCLILHHPAMV